MENIEPRTDGDHIVAQALETALGSKVEKEPGMGLSSNDYTAAEKAKLAGLENFSLPTFTYRNLCCNSRGDNLNGWRPIGSSSQISIDYDTFGYPAIKMTWFDNGHGDYYTGLTSTGSWLCDNWPNISSLCSDAEGTGSDHPVVVSYDIYTTAAHAISVSRIDEQFVPANRWERVVHRIPAGTLVDYLAIGRSDLRNAPETVIYYKNIQIEWGTEATPYCYNATLPMSLEEQLVPGEFWDGKQVYVRSFKGTTPGNTSPSHVEILLMTGVTHVLSFNASCILSDTYTDSIGMEYIFRKHAGSVYFYIQRPIPEDLSNKPYTAIFKYTKS